MTDTVTYHYNVNGEDKETTIELADYFISDEDDVKETLSDIEDGEDIENVSIVGVEGELADLFIGPETVDYAGFQEAVHLAEEYKRDAVIYYLMNISDSLDNFRDAFMFMADGKTDAAKRIAASYGMIDDNNPIFLYVDWEKFWDDFLCHDFIFDEESGAVFRII